jgi:hypothetical protein
VQSTMSCKKKSIRLSVWNNTLLLHKSNNSTRSTICSNNQTKFLRSNKYGSRATHKPSLSANQWQSGLKNMLKSP